MGPPSGRKFSGLDDLTLPDMVELSQEGSFSSKLRLEWDNRSPGLTDSTVATPRDLDSLPPIRSNDMVCFSSAPPLKPAARKKRDCSKNSVHMNAEKQYWGATVFALHEKTCNCGDVFSHFRAIEKP
jgi:hypothetical protein